LYLPMTPKVPVRRRWAPVLRPGAWRSTSHHGDSPKAAGGPGPYRHLSAVRSKTYETGVATKANSTAGTTIKMKTRTCRTTNARG
jgi:hypothetical protein